MVRFVAAVDQGTTSTRCILFDQAGQPVALAQQEHQQIFPQPGWVEHDPLEIWANTQLVIRTALQQAGLTAHDIAALGVTNQRETTLVWRRSDGRPLANAIVWQDTRTAAICRDLAGTAGPDRFRPRVGLPLATYFSAPKLRWLLDHVPGAQAAAEAGDLLFGTIDSYLVWQLSGGPHGGVHVTDVTNASRTMLMNLQTCDWDAEMLRVFNIPRSMLPAIRSSSEVVATAVGDLAGVPIAGILGDQQAALFGQACFNPGEAKNTYGTGSFMLMNTGTQPVFSQHGLLTTVAYRSAGQPTVYALEGSIAVTGSLVQWLRDNLGLIDSSAAVEPLAASVADNGGVYIVPAFAGLFAPYWRDDARGVIVGLTRYATRGHIARAALEATAYQTRDVLAAMQQDSGVQLRALKVDGGMVTNELLMQFQADMLAVPVVRPTVSETTALGAAYAAGLAVGVWRSTDELRRNWRAARSWQPQMPAAQRDALYRRWQKAVTRAFDWIDEDDRRTERMS
jgi:glycerol kinase